MNPILENVIGGVVLAAILGAAGWATAFYRRIVSMHRDLRIALTLIVNHDHKLANQNDRLASLERWRVSPQSKKG